MFRENIPRPMTSSATQPHIFCAHGSLQPAPAPLQRSAFSRSRPVTSERYRYLRSPLHASPSSAFGIIVPTGIIEKHVNRQQFRHFMHLHLSADAARLAQGSPASLHKRKSHGHPAQRCRHRRQPSQRELYAQDRQRAGQAGARYAEARRHHLARHFVLQSGPGSRPAGRLGGVPRKAAEVGTACCSSRRNTTARSPAC